MSSQKDQKHSYAYEQEVEHLDDAQPADPISAALVSTLEQFLCSRALTAAASCTVYLYFTQRRYLFYYLYDAACMTRVRTYDVDNVSVLARCTCSLAGPPRSK